MRMRPVQTALSRALSRALPRAVFCALALGSAAGAHAFDPSDAALSASSSSYLYVPGDQAGGGTHYNDAPAPLVGFAAGSVATSSLVTTRTGTTGTRTGTSSGNDVASAGYGLLTTTSQAVVTTFGDPFLDGDTQVDTTARFDDAVTFFNPSFAPGAAFSVRLTMTLGFASTVSAANFARVYAYGQGGFAAGYGSFIAYESSTGNAAGDLGWHDPTVSTLDVSVVNGTTLNLFGALTTKAESSLYNGYCDHCSTTDLAQLNGASATYTLSGSDPGLRIQTASGWLYGVAAVPEPTAALLMLAGLVGLVGLAEARRRKAPIPLR
jgi:hypothetical protein